MKLTCDLCGGELRTDLGVQGATCSVCGLVYPVERLREMLAGSEPVSPEPTKPNLPIPTPPKVHPAPNPYPEKAREAPQKAREAPKKAQKNMKTMWLILAVIGLLTFLSGLLLNGVLLMVSLLALLITLFLFKPWEVYGGKP